MSVIDFEKSRATLAQLKYIEQLTIDLQFSRVRRNAHICDIINRKIIYLDELTKDDASNVINKFKAWKESKTKTYNTAESRRDD